MDLTRSASSLFIANIFGNILSFGGLLYFSRSLGASEIGIFFLFQALVGISSIMSNLGTRDAIEKRMSEGTDPADVLCSGVLMKVVILVAVVTFILLASKNINSYIGRAWAPYLAVTVIVNEASQLVSRVLRGEHRVEVSAVLVIVNKVGWIGSGTLFVYFGYGTIGLVYGVIFGYMFRSIIGAILISTPLGRPSFEHIESIWEYSKYTIVPGLDEYIHNWTDITIMGLFLTSAAVGAYEISWRLLTPIFLLTGAVTTAIFPQISSWDATEEGERIERLFPKALTPSLILVIPSFFGALALSSEILVLLFGEGFGAAALALPILIAGLTPRALREVAGKTLQGIDRPQFVNRASIIDMAVNIVLNVLFILQFGLVGAAIATSISYTVGASLRWYYLSTHLTIRVPYYEIGWCTLSAIGMYLALLLAKTQIAIESVPRLFAIVSLGVAIYGVFILLYTPLRTTLFSYANRLIPSSI